MLTPFDSYAAKGGNGGGGGRLSPASLDIATSTFGPPVCESQTSWVLEKTTETGDMTDPENSPFSFDIKVTEGPTSTILSG